MLMIGVAGGLSTLGMIKCALNTFTIRKMEKNKALELLEEIESNVSVCCAITMEPDMVLELIEQLRDEINKL